MHYPESNASFQALRLPGELFGSDARVLRELWDSIRKILTEANEILLCRAHGWEQDWLLAKFGAESAVRVENSNTNVLVVSPPRIGNDQSKDCQSPRTKSTVSLPARAARSCRQ